MRELMERKRKLYQLLNHPYIKDSVDEMQHLLAQFELNTINKDVEDIWAKQRSEEHRPNVSN